MKVYVPIVTKAEMTNITSTSWKMELNGIWEWRDVLEEENEEETIDFETVLERMFGVKIHEDENEQ